MANLEFTREDKALLLQKWPPHRSRSAEHNETRNALLAQFAARGFAKHQVYRCLESLGFSKTGERHHNGHAPSADVEKILVDLSDMVNLIADEFEAYRSSSKEMFQTMQRGMDFLARDIANLKQEQEAKPPADPLAALRARLGR